MEIIYIFSKERCSYTLGNQTFLYFRNNPLHLPLSPPPPPKKVLIFQKTEITKKNLNFLAPSLKNFLYCKRKYLNFEKQIKKSAQNSFL